MTRIRLGEDFLGFEGELEKTEEEELADIPKKPCCLCHRLQPVDEKYLCDGKRACPFLSEMIKGYYVDCIEF